MSEANNLRVSLIQRTDFGAPASPLNMQVLLTTGQSLRNQVGYAQSQTIRSDANVQDLVRLSLSANGGLPLELQFPTVNEALWRLLRAALRADEVAEASFSSCSITGGQSTINKTGIHTTVDVGDIVRLSGASGVDNGFTRVLSKITDQLTVDKTWVGSSSSVTVVRGARMTNGTLKYFFDVEVSHLEQSPTPQLHQFFEKFAVDTMAMTVSDQAITSCAFGLIGVSSQRSNTEFGAAYAQPTAGPILDALGVPVFRSGTTDYSAKSFGFSLSNNIRQRTEVGPNIGAKALPFGACTATTRVQSYFQNFIDLDAYNNNVAQSIWWVMQNVNNQALSIAFPQHKWTDLSTPTQGLNTDDYLDGSGQAIVHPTQLCTMRVQRWVA